MDRSDKGAKAAGVAGSAKYARAPEGATLPRVEVRVQLKPGVMDAEAEAVRKALGLLGVPGVEHVSVARVYSLDFSHADAKEARRRAELAVERLLANPVIHRVEIHAGETRGGD